MFSSLNGISYQEEESDLEREKREASVQIESLEGAKKEGEEHVQSLKQQVEALREESDRLGEEITERKVLLASIEEKRKGMEGQQAGLSESLKTLKGQILKKVSGIRECKVEGPFPCRKDRAVGKRTGNRAGGAPAQRRDPGRSQGEGGGPFKRVERGGGLVKVPSPGTGGGPSEDPRGRDPQSQRFN